METRVVGLRQELFAEALIINVRLVEQYWNAARKHFMQSIPKSLRFSGKIWNMERGNFAWLNSASTNSHHLLQTWQLCQSPPSRPPSRKKSDKCKPSPCPRRCSSQKYLEKLLNFHAGTSEKRRSQPSRSLRYLGSFELTRPYHSILTHGAVVGVLLSRRRMEKLFRAPVCVLSTKKSAMQFLLASRFHYGGVSSTRLSMHDK